MLYELHRKTPNNIGDYWCNPSRYFNFGEVKSGELVNNKFPVTDQSVIIGGGGLIHKKFQTDIEKILDKKPRLSALWGIGHNFGRKHVIKSGEKVYYPDWINKSELIGIRDWIEGYKKYYVPCVSCMHSAFDKTYETKYDIVYFLHAYKSNFIPKENDVCMKNNEKDFNKVIKFLASGRTIVTDSYHGAYWSQLLGKDVKIVSWSVKFDHMKYPPEVLDSINTAPKFSKTSVPKNYLEECRTYNNNFYKKFMEKYND